MNDEKKKRKTIIFMFLYNVSPPKKTKIDVYVHIYCIILENVLNIVVQFVQIERIRNSFICMMSKTIMIKRLHFEREKTPYLFLFLSDE